MEKLIELLNEREEKEKISKIKWRIDNNPIGIYWYVWKYWLWFASKMIIISKEYGFIKRLDKHNRIDRTYKKNLNYPYYIRKRDGELKWYKRYEMLTMLLSISNKPIDLLISMLK